MISKKSQKSGVSSIKQLGNYIANPSKAQSVRITNCLSDKLDLAIKEIQCTQALNKRAKSDKVYHLIVSFQAGENPSPGVLKEIEDTFCKALGFADHQRLSAIHSDTNNIHMHIAINKIHPKTFTLQDPLRDFYIRDALCRELEVKYNLKTDKGIGKDKGLSGRSADMEAHSGIESFRSWVKKTAAGDLKVVLSSPQTSWKDVHTVLAKYNLAIRKRGAGFVISDRNRKLFVKASGVSRELSKSALEKKIGAYVEPDLETTAIPAQARYEKQPIHHHSERNGLYNQYQQWRTDTLLQKKELLEQLKIEQQERFKVLQEKFSKRRHEIKRDPLVRKKNKRLLYGKLKAYRIQEYTALKEEIRERRSDIHRKYKLHSWQDFLVNEAIRGNDIALAVLRSRKVKRFDSGYNIIKSDEIPEQILYSNLDYQVNKNGDVVYHLNGERIQDEGDLLRLADVNDSALLATLQIAKQKFGHCLDIQGSDDFKRRAVSLSALNALDINFADSDMEAARKAILGGISGRDVEKNKIITAFINKRNETRRKVKDILPHRAYEPGDSGRSIYLGQRQLSGGLKVGLFEKKGEIAVMPLSDNQAAKLKQYGVGQSVNINKQGFITGKDLER